MIVIFSDSELVVCVFVALIVFWYDFFDQFSKSTLATFSHQCWVGLVGSRLGVYNIFLFNGRAPGDPLAKVRLLHTGRDLDHALMDFADFQFFSD